jgi:hypothetical protein
LAENQADAGQEKPVDRLRFVSHRDQRILLLDFTNCTADEVAAISESAPDVVTHEPLHSLLVVADFSGAEFDRDAIERIKVSMAIDRLHIKRAAWVLTENLAKTLYESVRNFTARDFPVFATRDEALDYVVSADSAK